MTSGVPRDHFFSGLARAVAPLLLWAAHFWSCYVLVAVGCHGGWFASATGAVPPLRLGLWLITALAVALAAWLVWRACRRHRREGAPLAHRAEVVSGVLGLVAIAWGSVPLLVMPLCHLT